MLNIKYILLLTYIFISCKIVGIAHYQDILVNNKIIASGRVSCEERYKAFKPILDKFSRPFTFLDIGASEGFFSFKTAYDFRYSTGVMIEGGYSYTNAHDLFPDKLLKLCKQNTALNNIIFLKKQVTIAELEELSKCEHFDVVFVFNVLHHFKNNWKEAVDTILKLGTHIIIELPDYAPIKLQDYIANKAPTILGIFKHSINNNSIATMRYYYNNKTNFLSRAYGYEKKENYIYNIENDFVKKELLKINENKQIISKKNWIPGINLCTFKLLNGVWPNKKILTESWRSLSITNNNILPWDIIIQGENLQILPTSSLLNNPCSYEYIIEFINSTSIKDVIKLLPYQLYNAKINT